MSAFGGAYLTGSPWIGVLCGGAGRRRCWPRCTACCARCRGVNDVATGIALMMLGHRPGLLLRQAADPAAGAADPVHRAGRLERFAGHPLGAAGQRAVRRSAWRWRSRCGGPLPARAGACWCAWPATRPTPRAPWAIRSSGIRIAATAAGGFIAGLGGASLIAVLPGQLERRHLQRPGPDRRGARHLRALEPAALPRRGAAVRRRRAPSARRCSRSASAGATTCSTPCPTC